MAVVRWSWYSAVLALVALVWAFSPVAAAKEGPVGITISGPGLHHPIEIHGTVRTNPNQNHYRLVEETRFFDLMFGVDGQPLPQEKQRLSGGDMYMIEWIWDSTPIPMEIYPYQENGPMVHMAPGLHGFSTDGEYHYGVGVRGGWVHADPTLFDLLVEFGVPLDPEQVDETNDGPLAAAKLSAGAAIAGMLLWVVRHRRSRLMDNHA